MNGKRWETVDRETHRGCFISSPLRFSSPAASDSASNPLKTLPATRASKDSGYGKILTENQEQQQQQQQQQHFLDSFLSQNLEFHGVEPLYQGVFRGPPSACAALCARDAPGCRFVTAVELGSENTYRCTFLGGGGGVEWRTRVKKQISHTFLNPCRAFVRIFV